MSEAITGEQLERLRRLLAGHCRIHDPSSWDRDALGSLLRFGRKHDGPWIEDSGPIPDETDADLICSAVKMLPVMLDELGRLRELKGAVIYLREIHGDDPDGSEKSHYFWDKIEAILEEKP